MFPILLVLFTVIPALEFYILFSAGDYIGGLNTIFIIIATGIIGASLAKSQGLVIIQKIQHSLSQGSLPTDQIVHGLMVFAGGILLLTPGFLTDIFGLSMVIPGSRHILAVFMKSIFEKAIESGNIQFSSFSHGPAAGHDHPHSPETGAEFHHQQPETLEADVFEADYTKKEEE
ncbi:MAG: UPF0716 protein FxsA [Thermoproteota archaeon]|jgi:UPF0716 protein FxsA